MTTITIASSDEHLLEILALQQQYHFRTLSNAVQDAEGFVYAEHTLAILKRMSALSPQAIALADGHVVGYCLTLPVPLKHEVPSLAPMFAQFEQTDFRGRPLSTYEFVVGGQVCVAREYRGQGLVGGLYGAVREVVAERCDLCVTEIAMRNRVSLRAHEKIGFETIATYSDGTEEWAVVAWPFR